MHETNKLITFADVNKKQINNNLDLEATAIRQNIMNKKQTALMIALAAIASANKEGYTVNAATLQPITTGYAVAVKDTQNSFDPEGLANVIRYVEEHPEVNAFGGWYDSESGLYYYDATIIVYDLDQALELGRANDQLAIFDLTNCKEIRL